MTKKIVLTVLLVVVCIIVLQLLNHEIIERIIIGDACHYDTENIQTGELFNCFYTISSNTGYHPEPNLFNVICTTCCGLLIGLFIAYKVLWRKK